MFYPRHEMQHFVNVMQGYVVNQVIHVSWEGVPERSQGKREYHHPTHQGE